MRNFYLFIACALMAFSAEAQKIISNGFPNVGVLDGTNYARTGDINTPNISFVAAGGTTAVAASQMGKLYFLNLVAETIADSLTLQTGDMEMDGNTLFGISGQYVYRIDGIAKSIIDSTLVASNPFRIEKRPGAKEMWISDSTMVHVLDYSSGISKSSFVAGVSEYDRGVTRFAKGGTLAYKGAPLTHRVYKIDAANKTLIDSADIPGNNNSSIAISSDSSKLFVSTPADHRIYIVNTATMDVVDSIVTTREPFELYAHPTRAEIWCVNHYDDTVTVYKESDYSVLAAIDLPPSPHNLAFVLPSVGINDLAFATIDAVVYPNPASQQITVSLPVGEKYHIVVLDNAGRTIYTIDTHQSFATVPVAGLPSGVYHLHIENGKGGVCRLNWTKL